METLGQYLKREREFRRISLDEISEASKVSVYYLQQLEADNLDALPRDAFIRGFLKSYANHVGLDVSDVLLRFEVMRERKESIPPRPKARSFVGFRRKIRIAIFVVVLTVIVLLSLYFSSR